MQPNSNQELVTFLDHLGDYRGVMRGYDYLPGVYCFVKDSRSRLMTANQQYCNRLGICDPCDLTGRIDEEFCNPSLAKCYIDDDQRVFASGKPLENRLEQCFDERGKLDWYCTTKLPLFDKQGAIIGLMGIMRRSGQVSASGGSDALKSVVNYIKGNLDQSLTLEELSGKVNLSVRQLSRHFQETFGETTHSFVLRMRVQAASEALINTNDSILEISLQYGFSDQSAFTKIFRRQMNLTPRQFRSRYQRR